MLCGQGVPVEPGEDTVRQLLPDAPDFFRVDALYVRKLPYTAPEHREEFRCVAVGPDPNTGGLMAFGWAREGCEGTFGPAACSQEIWERGWMVLPDPES
jgi:hypothetical protein